VAQVVLRPRNSPWRCGAGGGANTWREAFIKQFSPGNGSTIKMVEVPNPAGALRSPAAAGQYSLALVTYFEAIALSNAGLIESFDDKQLPGIGDVDPKFLTKDKAGRHVGPASLLHLLRHRLQHRPRQSGGLRLVAGTRRSEVEGQAVADPPGSISRPTTR
jgi:hypothetical protein